MFPEGEGEVADLREPGDEQLLTSFCPRWGVGRGRSTSGLGAAVAPPVRCLDHRRAHRPRPGVGPRKAPPRRRAKECPPRRSGQGWPRPGVGPRKGAHEGDRQLRRLRPVLPAAAQRHHGHARQRGRQGHPGGRLLRRGHHVDGRRGGPHRPAAAPEGSQDPTVWFATTDPAYLDKTNATAIHAALGLAASAAAYDMIGSVRSGVGGVRRRPTPTDGLAVVATSAPACPAAPTSPTAATPPSPSCSARARSSPSPSAAPRPPASSSTAGAPRASAASRQWEERFGEHAYVPLAEAAVTDALKPAGLTAADARPPHRGRPARPRRRGPWPRPSAPAPRPTSTTSPRVDRQHRHRPRRARCWPTCSTAPSPARRSPLVHAGRRRRRVAPAHHRRASSRRRPSPDRAPSRSRPRATTSPYAHVPHLARAAATASRPAGPTRPRRRRRRRSAARRGSSASSARR